MSIYLPYKNPFLSRRPYVYVIMWTKLNVAYVGVRHAKGCQPDDLWTTYFTSSKYVSEFRQQNGEPDHIEILDTFLTAREAIAAEYEIIKDFELHLSPVFLNRNCGGQIIFDDKMRNDISKRFNDPAYKQNLSDKLKEHARTIPFNGDLVSVTDLVQQTGISGPYIYSRLRSGQTIEEIISSRKRRRLDIIFRAFGVDRTLRDWLNLYPEVTSRRFRSRLQQGFTVERALTQRFRKPRSNP